MAKLTRREIDQLLKDVTNPSLNIKKREAQLAKLEGWAKTELKKGVQNFDASFKGVDKTLSAFEDGYRLLNKAISPVNEAAVDKLMTQAKDEVRLEKMLTSKQDIALMKRLNALKNTLPSASISKQSAAVQDAQRQQRVNDLKGTSKKSAAEQDAELQRRLDALKGTSKKSAAEQDPELQRRLDALKGTSKKSAAEQDAELQRRLNALKGIPTAQKADLQKSTRTSQNDASPSVKKTTLTNTRPITSQVTGQTQRNTAPLIPPKSTPKMSDWHTKSQSKRSESHQELTKTQKTLNIVQKIFSSLKETQQRYKIKLQEFRQQMKEKAALQKAKKDKSPDGNKPKSPRP